MIENIEDLDLAVETLLEKATANTRAHVAAATMTQKDYDKHADALAHHASAIMHYREQPKVKKYLETLQALVPHRAYINKPIKMGNAKPTELTKEDLNQEHPFVKGLDEANKQKHVDELNTAIKGAHKMQSDPQINALHEHGKRFLAHMVAMTELHNLEKKGEIPHSQFSAHLHAPEITDSSARVPDSEYRGHSHAGGGKYTTQSVTKHGGAMWHPGIPEHTALEENSGHASVGQPKKLYPFSQVKVNGEPLKMKTFERDPRTIHAADAMTNLGKEHEVRHPETGQKVPAMGAYYGSHSADLNQAGMERTGVIKKTADAGLSSYFPNVTVAHFIFAKNFLKSMNPFDVMSDEHFGDYLLDAMAKDDSPSQQAAALAEASSRLEKAKKEPASKDKTDAHEADAYRRQKRHEAHHQQGVNEVLSGKVTPLPTTEAAHRTEKEGEKRDELADINRGAGFSRKRSPYAVPAHVFTDDTYSKVDPAKYKEWVNGPMSEDDLRHEHATYGNVVRHNPDAQERHKDFIDLHREQAQSGIKSALNSPGQDEDVGTPVMDHKETMRKLGEDLKSGKITAAQFAEKNAKALKERSSNVSGKAGQEDLTEGQKAVREQDPSYTPRRVKGEEAAAAGMNKDLTRIAGGEIPAKYLADPSGSGDQDEHSAARAKELTGGRGEDGEGTARGSITSSPGPIKLVSDHPGFKAYLQLKDHLLSHYKDPAVREYMENKINQHENNPNFDVARLAGTLGMLHRSQEQAQRAGRGQKKLMGDIAGATDPVDEGTAVAGEDNSSGKGSAMHPETMMTPDQRNRLNEVRSAKPASEPQGPTGAMPPPPNPDAPQPGKVRTAKDMSPEELAAITARYNKPKTGPR